MNGLTRIFLVVLRLVIGWHFLFEGLEKLNSDSWSSETYLREAAGPLGPTFHRMAGDHLLDELTPQELPGKDPAKTPPRDFLPPTLAGEWQAYFDRFVQHYNLNSDQIKQAEDKLRQQEDDTALWLQGKPPSGTKKVTITSPVGPPVQVEETTPERVRKYQEKVREIHEFETKMLPHSSTTIFGSQENVRLRADKADASRLRTELADDLRQHTEKVKDELYSVLDATQKEMAPLPADTTPLWQHWHGWRSWSSLEWIDRVVPIGLTAVGLCLLLGLFTRTFCLIGAAFLLAFFLAMPPLPGVPDNPRAEGHYLFINKNIIEMVALLALATTRSGRWVGLDALLQFLNPWRWRRRSLPAQDLSRRLQRIS